MKDTAGRLYETVLVLRYQMGDDTAFAQLVARHHPKLRYYLRRLLGRDDQADDILQETWLEVHARRAKLKAPGAFAAWVFRIARNKAMHLMRKQRRLPRMVVEAELPDTQEPDEEPIPPGDAASVHLCLDKLSAEHKEVLVLRFLEDMSYEDIANVVDCRIGTVRSRIHYAKLALRRELENINHAK